MKRFIKKASTDVTVEIFIQDSSSTTGAGLTGLVFNSAGLACYYVRPLAVAAALSLVTQTVTGAHTDGGFVEIDATNMPGVYRLDLSDAIVATGKDNVSVMLEGATNMAPVLLEIQLTDIDVNDAVRAGLTALPNAAADAAGGLVISDAGGLDLDAKLANTNEITVARMGALTDWLNGGRLDLLLDAIPTTAMRGTDGALTDKAGFSLAATGLDAIVSTATGMVEIAKAIWDRALTGATHNIATSAGRKLRQLTGMVYTDGTAQAGGVNTITLEAGESATDDIFWQSYIAIVGGTGAGQGHHVIAYNGTTKVAVMDDDWVVAPDATSEYVIFGAGSHDEIMSGLARAGSASTLTLEAVAHSGDELIKDCYIVILSGTGAHQARLITAYNGTTKVATIYPDWVVNPDATSGYWILPRGQNNVWDQLLSGSVHNINTSSGKRLRQLSENIAYEGTVNDAGASTISFVIDSGASSVDDFYVDQTFRFTDGALEGQSRIVLTYTGATRTVTFDEALTSAPANGVGFQILADHVHPTDQIADAVWDELTANHTTAGTTSKALIDIKAKTDNLPDGIQKNTALANFPFFMVDDTDNVTGKTGLSITAQRSIDGAAFGNCANSATELSNGVYVIDLAASDLNGDTIIFKFTGTDALARLITVIPQT